MSRDKRLDELCYSYFEKSTWCFKKYEDVYFKGFSDGRDSLELENSELKDLIKECIDVFEHGVNQWASAWSPNEETRGQKQI